jgi:nucleoside 2-deoxyribosyltransferase
MRLYLAGPLFTPYERSFIGEYGSRLRQEGFDCFIPHEHWLDGAELTPQAVFQKDGAGLMEADAVLALLDGPMVDDGTACEIGLFYGLKQRDPRKKGVIGLLTDSRQGAPADGSAGSSTNLEGKGLNFYVLGCIEATGGTVVQTVDDALPWLRRWQAELSGEHS